MAKLNVGNIRELHKHLGSLLADHDAACAQEQADKARKVGATDNPPHTPGTPEPPAGKDADPLGLNRLAHARNGRGFV